MQVPASDTPPSSAAPTRWVGLLRYQSCWRPTPRGWLVLVILGLLGVAVVLRGVHPFLSVNRPVQAEVLVVEGWLADSALEAAAGKFREGAYTTIYVTGIPLERGAPLSEFQTYAALGRAVLVQFGVPTNAVHAVPAPTVRRDRTYASALALRDWLESAGEMPERLDLLTVGPHARRSRLLYRYAFGERCTVGVLAVQEQDYDPHEWWRYSQGVRAVTGETLAYLYARFLFPHSADRRPEQE